MKLVWTVCRFPQVLVGAAVVFLVSWLSFGTAGLREDLPCAVTGGGTSKEATELLEYLEHYDFLFCETREEVERAVTEGAADCGAVIADDLDERMRDGDMEGVCELIVSDRSSLQDSYSLLLCVGILREYAPDLTRQLLMERGYELTMEEVAAYFERAQAELTPMTFVVTDLEGEAMEAEPGDQLPVGLTAITAFLLYGFLAVSMVRQPAEGVRIRFVSERAFLGCVLLPRLIPIGLLLGACTGAGILCGSRLMDIEILPLLAAAVGYYALLTILFAALLILPVGSHVLICAIGLDAAVSLVLCPLYQNIALLVPGGGLLRIFSIPYLFYFLRGHPMLSLCAAAGSAGVILYLERRDQQLKNSRICAT